MRDEKEFRNSCLGRSCCVALMLCAIAPHAAAQAYPSRPLRIIVPSASGGAPDIAARQFAHEIGRQVGQQVVVDNRPGASGIIGYEMIARAVPDGYTIGYLPLGFATNPSLYAKLPYDSNKDFHPIIQAASGAQMLGVSPSLAIRSVKELIELARAKPGALSFGSSGNGSGQHLAMELLKVMTKTNIVHVSYKGIQQAITDVIGGQIALVCDSTPSILPHVWSGRLRALGVTSMTRLSAAPDVPTLHEAGVPGFETTVWAGYTFPARTPRERVLRMNAEFNKALLSPSVSKWMAERGATPVGGTPEQFVEHLKREIAKWAGVIRAAGIAPQ